MVPCLLWWEFIKGFLREDISEVMVLGQHHVLKGSAYLSLLCFLGQPLRWGICSPNVVFCPLRGDECGINRISGFWSVVLCHASICLPSTLRRASRHGDTLASPVNFQVVMGKPQMSNDDGVPSEVGNCKACFLCVLAIPEYDLNFLCDGSVLVWGSIYVVNWYWVWQGVSLQLVLLGKGLIDKHPCCT